MNRKAMLAGALLAAWMVVPATAQTVSQIQYVTIGLDGFPDTAARWRLGTRTGTIGILPGTSNTFELPPATPIPSTVPIILVDRARDLEICRFDLNFNDPETCAPFVPTGGCSLVEWGSSGGTCTLRLRKD